MVDFLRDTITDTIRPFRDAPEVEVKRVWYPVPWGTPTLPYPTAFTCARWEPFPYLARDVGEVYPPKFEFKKNPTPEGLTYKHVCGTIDQFARGAFLPADPVVERDADGIPACCRRVAVPIPVPPPSGQCFTAPLLQMNQWYSSQLFQGERQWWKFGISTPGEYHVESTGLFGEFNAVGGRLGELVNCFFQAHVFAEPGCRSFVAVGGRELALAAFNDFIGPPQPYTFRVNPGPCPG